MERHAPAALRNRDPIADVLARELPACGGIVEIASGSGEHAVYFARLFPQLAWQPTDVEAEALLSIGARVERAQLPNLDAPLRLDAGEVDWPIRAADALLCVNMVHISPWQATLGLFAGASALLERAAPLILYGPFLEENVETAASNLEFDASLRLRNGEWGLRKLSDVDRIAVLNGLERTARHELPANNLMLVYRKT